MNHTELGHIRVARKAGDTFPGMCPFHGDCIEGLASGPAIESARRQAGLATRRRITRPGISWRTASAQLLHTMVLTTAPPRIFLGGGVMSAQAHLFERIQQELKRSLNGYVEAPELEQDLAHYIVPPGLGSDGRTAGRAGARGAMPSRSSPACRAPSPAASR